MKSLNIAYFGSSYFSATLLEHILIDKELSVNLKFVITQPDKKVGRKQILTPTPVKIVANKYKKSKDTFFEIIARGPYRGVAVEKNGIELKDIDLALVYAYGNLIPKDFLSLPKYGFWNIHPSLLPKYRGTSPIATPLINGEKITGVTIIKMDEEIDHGPIIVQESLEIENNDKRPDLEKKLTDLGFEMFKKIIKNSPNSLNSLNIKIQNDKEATYTKKMSKQDGFIEFKKLNEIFQKPTLNSSLIIFNLFRGLYPWPGIWTTLPSGKRLKITDMNFIKNKLVFKKVQLEGKKEVDFETFNKAYKVF